MKVANHNMLNEQCGVDLEHQFICMDAKDNNNTASNLIPTVPDVSSKHFGIRGKRHIPRDMGPKKLYCCNGKST